MLRGCRTGKGVPRDTADAFLAAGAHLYNEAVLATAWCVQPHGGAAGGGKTVALLAAALAHVDVPGYSALLLRRTYRDLALPGALMDLSHQWLSGTDARWNGVEYRWTFPSGATVSFGYLDTDRDKHRYQSSEFQFIGFDELTQFPEGSYLYLFSRLRKRESMVVPYEVPISISPDLDNLDRDIWQP